MLSKTVPKNEFIPLGKSWKGGETLFLILGDASLRSAWQCWWFFLPLGKSWKGVFYPFRLKRRFLTTLEMTQKKSFWGNGGDPSLRSGRPKYGRLGRGVPFPLCVTPNAVRGLLLESRRWTDPPRTPPENKKGGDVSLRSTWHKKSLFDGDKAEILRFAQDDQNTVGWEGVSPSHYVSPRTQWGVSSLNRGGELTLLELYPKRINWGDSSLQTTLVRMTMIGEGKNPLPTPPKKHKK